MGLQLLTTENEIRKLLSSKKTGSFVLLYHSLWDPYSKKVMKLAEEYTCRTNSTVYCIDSWHTPEAFAAFKVMSAPTVVEVNKGKVTVHVEYPKVYDFFSLSEASPTV